jgi:hypothetical protein
MTTKNKDIKAGIRTSEFWITVIVAAGSLAWGAGYLDPEGTAGADKVFGFVCSALAALGYTVSRGLAKQVKK